MKYDLEKVRKTYAMTTEKFAEICGIAPYYYDIYEKKGEIPCKYIYNLKKEIQDLPVPEDFFFYSSFSLIANMKYHHMKQVEVAEKFQVMQQTISHYVTGAPFLMYEWKDKFLNTFSPFIIVTECVVRNDNGDIFMQSIDNYISKGNLMSYDRKKEYKVFREETGITVVEHRKMRNQENTDLLRARKNGLVMV